MAFKVIDGRGRSRGRTSSDTCDVTYLGKSAQFRLSPVAVAALGGADAVEIQYDEETNRIALVPSTEPHAVKLRADTPDAPSRQFSFRGLAAMLHLPDDGRIVMNAEADGNTLIVELPAASE